MIQLGYNVFDIREPKDKIEMYDDYLGQSGIKRLISLAQSEDVGVIAMKVLKVGGKRQNLENYRTATSSIFQAMLKWALENGNVSSAVTEMLTFDQLDEDLAVVGQRFSAKERKTLLRYVVENSEDYCHLCGLCENHCPGRIKTTSILHSLAYYDSYGKIAMAKKAYSRLKPFQTAGSCQNCRTCERVCPYGVSVHRRIREADYYLG